MSPNDDAVGSLMRPYRAAFSLVGVAATAIGLIASVIACGTHSSGAALGDSPPLLDEFPGRCNASGQCISALYPSPSSQGPLLADSESVYLTVSFGTGESEFVRLSLADGGLAQLGGGGDYCSQSGGSLYCVNSQGIVRVPVDGGAAAQVGSPTSLFPTALAVNSATVFIATGSALFSTAMTGGPLVQVAEGIGSVTALAADDTNLYWINPAADDAGNGTVLQVPVAGGAPTVLADGQPMPLELAIDRKNVYWTNHVANGSVMKVPIGGGPVEALARDQTSPSLLAADGTSVYWVITADGGSAPLGEILRAPASGGTPITLVVNQTVPVAMTSSASSLFWVDHPGNGPDGIAQGLMELSPK